MSDSQGLKFKHFTLDSIDEIRPYLHMLKSNTCDFTIAGIYMWIDFFKYKYCVYRDTLFIIGREEDDLSQVAFSVPIGNMPLGDAVEAVRQYCEAKGIRMVFSAVPEVYLDDFRVLSPRRVSEIEGWTDYLYSAEELATLPGRKFNKKRNHINKFKSLYPQAQCCPINNDNIDEVKEFYRWLRPRVKENPIAEFEYRQVGVILDNYFSFDFISQVLSVDGNIIAFAIGEIVGDTLHADIEKTNHDYAGASEYLNYMFINYALSLNSNLKYENRQDDAGDEGLKKAKLSYNPIALLKKYDVIF